MLHDVIEAHCYVVVIGRTDCEQMHSRINNNCLQKPHKPVSTVYKTVLYAVDKGIWGPKRHAISWYSFY